MVSHRSNLPSSLELVFKKPGGKLVFKLNDNANAAAINHLVFADHPRFAKAANDFLGRSVAQPTYSHFLPDFHYQSVLELNK